MSWVDRSIPGAVPKNCHAPMTGAAKESAESLIAFGKALRQFSLAQIREGRGRFQLPRYWGLGGILLLTSALTTAATAAIAPVWTEHNDNGRTGQYLTETTLTPANVNQTQFGKVFVHNLDDQSYAQPLYVPGLTMAIDSTVHNVVFVTTVNNSVYAFDADSGAAHGGQPLWHVNLTPNGARAPNVHDADSQGACGGGYNDFAGQYGIVGTPVINTTTNTLYVVARTVENNAFIQRLHALDLTSGAEKLGGPVTITGSYGGTTFDSALNNQRTALALVNGIIYIGWSSHCDNGGYHGYVMGYNASTLAQTGAWATTNSNGWGAGVWQGGQGVTADVNHNLYFMTGNGTWDGNGNYGESFVKLTSGLSLTDYFTPSNYNDLNNYDDDLGSAGCMGIPGTTLIVGGGKRGMVYLLDTANLGHENGTDSVVQEFQATFPQGGNSGHIHGGPIYFNSNNGQFVYVWGENDYLHAYQFTNGVASNQGSFNTTAVASSTMLAPMTNAGMPGGFLSLSANGKTNGIVWALTPYDGNANQSTVHGILHAFDAQTFNSGHLTELWSSEQNSSRDTVGNYAKFTYPTVANGRVYVSTFGSTYSGSGQLIAYGEGPAQVTATPVISSSSNIVPQQVTITDSTANSTIYYTIDGAVPTPGNADTFVYSGPFTVSACETVTANAAVLQAGWLPSATSTAAFTKAGTHGAGSGLTATYFSNMDLTGSEYRRVDPTVNFVWQTNPAPGIGTSMWSSRWEGSVLPEFTDTYTFTTVTDDGVRLWVNNQLVVDDWNDQPPTAKSGTIALTAGQKYPIKMEFYQNQGGMQAQLYWSSACQGQQIVPASQLFALPNIATHFSVTCPSTVVADTPFTVTVKALDVHNNIVTNYPGTVKLWTNAPRPVLQTIHTLTIGVGTISVTLTQNNTTTNNFKISAGDTVVTNLTGTSGAITVNPAVASKLLVTAPASVVVNTPFQFTVTAVDNYNHIVPNYTGTVQMYTNAPRAVMPPNSTLTNGRGTFNATMTVVGTTANNFKISARDITTTTIAGTSAAITVTSH